MTRRDELLPRLADSLRLYVLTDRELSGGRSDQEIVRDAITGGATAVQLRWKEGPLRDAVMVARELAELCRQEEVLFFVNDRVDLALAVGADGVHVGEDDLPVGLTRELVGEQMLIGYSPPTLTDAVVAERQGADYLGVGPVYGTTTKADAGVPVGSERIKDVASAVQIPLVGIGGIKAGNAAPVVESGAAGVAVISAIVAQPDVVAAAQELRAEIDTALKGRTTT